MKWYELVLTRVRRKCGSLVVVVWARFPVITLLRPDSRRGFDFSSSTKKYFSILIFFFHIKIPSIWIVEYQYLGAGLNINLKLHHFLLCLLIISHDIVSANTASWFPKRYKKSDGSQDAYKGRFQKRFSGFLPLRGGGYPPIPLRKKSAKKRLFLA